MKSEYALLAAVLLALGCHGAPRATSAAGQAAATFQAAATLLDQLAAAPANVVPDAVLNRARCIVIVPHSGSSPANGAASCRDRFERWEKPALVRFTPARPAAGDLLIFVQNNRAAEQLVRTGLRLGANASDRAGPVLPQVATVTEADMAADTLSYERSGRVTVGKAVAGAFTLTATAGAVPAVAEAGQRLLTATTSFFNTITPQGIIIHHSAVIPGDARIPANEREVDSFHRARGFDIVCEGREYHVAYHYLIFPDGRVQAGRPERCEGAHARGYNAYLGVAVFGDFSSADNPRAQKGPATPTRAQMRALATLCRRLMERYHIPLQHVLRHSDVANTRCPGDRFPFAILLQGLQAGAARR